MPTTKTSVTYNPPRMSDVLIARATRLINTAPTSGEVLDAWQEAQDLLQDWARKYGSYQARQIRARILLRTGTRVRNAIALLTHQRQRNLLGE
jgi:hypothetical protein